MFGRDGGRQEGTPAYHQVRYVDDLEAAPMLGATSPKRDAVMLPRKLAEEYHKDGELRRYLDKPGIPMPPRGRFKCLQFIGWLATISLVNYIVFWFLCSAATTQTKIYIPAGVDTVHLDLEHCNFEIMDSGYDGGEVSIQHWNFMGTSQLFLEENAVNAMAKMSLIWPMFRCQVRLQIPQGLKKIYGHVYGHEASHGAMDFAPAELLDLDVDDVVFKIHALPPSLKLNAKDGSITIHPRQPLDRASKVDVSVEHASMQVVMQEPFKVKAKGDARETSIYSGVSVEEQGDFVHLAPGAPGAASAYTERRLGEAKLEIEFQSNSEGPGYFLAKLDSDSVESLQTFIPPGSRQQSSSPELTVEGTNTMSDIKQWVKDISLTTIPWVVHLHIRGPGVPCGYWAVVPSEAYLMMRPEWLALLSANMLHPEQKEASVQLLGLKGQWPPQEGASDDRCVDTGGVADRRDEQLMKMVELLVPKLDPPQGTILAWKPEGKVFSTAVLFKKDLLGRRWKAQYHNHFAGQSLMFVFALSLNMLASAILASLLLYFTYSFMWGFLGARSKTSSVGVVSSHTLVHSSSLQAWRLSASQVEYPDHGVLLRWAKRTGELRPIYYWIHAEASKDPVRGLEYHEVMLERVENDKVPTMTESSAVKEFFFAIDPSNSGESYEPTQLFGGGLRYMHCYRFQIRGTDAEGRCLLNSEWSNEVFIAPPPSILETPLHLIKQLCPVPTDSFYYFIEHYTKRHIRGKMPQHLVVLNDIRVTFHKNYHDFQYNDEEFFITMYAGDTREACQAETFKGRCKTCDTTKPFSAPPKCLKEHEDLEEFERTVEVKGLKHQGQLMLGRTDTDLEALTLSMRWQSNGEEAAVGTVDWADLLEAFDLPEDEKVWPGEEEPRKMRQQIEIDLKVPDVEDFNEDYLCYLTATVSFASSIDAGCREVEPEERFFEKDAPGQIFNSGMMRFVSWPAQTKLMDRRRQKEFDLFLYFPDYPEKEGVNPIKVMEGVLLKTRGATIMMEVPPELTTANYAVCQICARAPAVAGAPAVELKTHRFVICKTWLLSDMEIMYASFCKMNGIAMQKLHKDVLRKYEVNARKLELKVVPGLRAPMPFERPSTQRFLGLGQGRDERDLVMKCAGSSIVSKETITAIDYNTAEERGYVDISDQASESKAGERGTSSKGGGSGPGTSGTKSTNGTVAEEQFSVTTERVRVVDSIWPTAPSNMFARLGLLGGAWSPHMLLIYDFYPVDNIMRFLHQLAMILQLDHLFSAGQVVIGVDRAEFLLKLTLTPLTYLLPAICVALLFVVQYVAFILLPLVPLAAALRLEWLQNEMNRAELLVEHHRHLHSSIPDLVFKRELSGRDVNDWFHNLSGSSYSIVVFSGVVSAMLVLLMMESNFLRDAWPWQIQATLVTVFNSLGMAIVYLIIWGTGFILSMIMLWFIMAVAIYPEHMIIPLGCVIALIIIANSAYSRYLALMDQINTFLKDEVPEVMEIVCDRFLTEFERTKAGDLRDRMFQEKQLTKVAYDNLRTYLRNRLASSPDLAQIVSQDSKEHAKVLKALHVRSTVKRTEWRDIPELADAGGESEYRDHYELAAIIGDRESELGGDAVHSFADDLREKLIRVFVRCLGDLKSSDQEVLAEKKKLGLAIFRAQRSKLEVLNPNAATRAKPTAPTTLFDTGPAEEQSTSLLQLLIQDKNQSSLKDLELVIARNLDVQLDSGNISNKVTPFIERTVPHVIKREIRLLLDEGIVKSQMHQILDRYKRWKNYTTKQGPTKLRSALTLYPCPSGPGPVREEAGLLHMLQKIGVLDNRASESYRTMVYNFLERKVREWKEEDEEELVIDANDAEGFVRELLAGNLWWGALKELLVQLGFPMAAGASRQNLVKQDDVMKLFEQDKSVLSNGGFLQKDKIFLFLNKLTGGEGRLWKAQVVSLMQTVQIAGFVGRAADVENPNLVKMARYAWPQWLIDIWNEKAVDGRHGGKFIPKREIYSFFEEVAFVVSGENPGENTVRVNEEYDNWLKERDELHVTQTMWRKGAKASLELRGIWHECFLTILKDMGCEIPELAAGVDLFDQAVKEQTLAYPSFPQHRRGLLTIPFLAKWLQQNMVERSDECTLETFRDVLKRCEISLPRIVETDIFFAAERTEQPQGPSGSALGSKDRERAAAPPKPSYRFGGAMRQVHDLEDRLVMYLTMGPCEESVVNLIRDEIAMRTVANISDQELRLSFRTIDTKLGDNGYLEPQEVLEMLTFLAQDGMTQDELFEALKQLGVNFPQKAIKDAFMSIDTNGDDSMDLPEFLGLIDYIVLRVIPQEIIVAMGYSPQQLIVRIVTALVVFAMLIFFIIISLGALQVNVAVSGAKAGESTALVRAGLAGIGIFALKRDTTDEDRENFFKTARERLYQMMGVSQSYVMARRRSAAVIGARRAQLQKRQAQKREEEELHEEEEGYLDDDTHF